METTLSTQSSLFFLHLTNLILENPWLEGHNPHISWSEERTKLKFVFPVKPLTMSPANSVSGPAECDPFSDPQQDHAQ